MYRCFHGELWVETQMLSLLQKENKDIAVIDVINRNFCFFSFFQKKVSLEYPSLHGRIPLVARKYPSLRFWQKICGISVFFFRFVAVDPFCNICYGMSVRIVLLAQSLMSVCTIKPWSYSVWHQDYYVATPEWVTMSTPSSAEQLRTLAKKVTTPLGIFMYARNITKP